MVSSTFTTRHANAKEKAPKRLCFRGFTPALLCGRKSRVLLHANYLALVVDRQVAPRHIIYAARHGAAARRIDRRRGGSASMPSAASRREAFTRSGADGSLDTSSAGTEGRRSPAFNRYQPRPREPVPVVLAEAPLPVVKLVQCFRPCSTAVWDAGDHDSPWSTLASTIPFRRRALRVEMRTANEHLQ
jgi:hypothetical protein